MKGAAVPLVFSDIVDEQFRLTKIQMFNWGTFSGVTTLAIPAKGFLVVGPSGSGKSTILDAHTALLTPPKWVSFNIAASGTQKGARDRNAMTYVRGAWSQQTGEAGDAVKQYLRTGTTWSAIAETYRTGNDRVVMLAQVLWVRGKSTANADVQKRYLVLEREFDIKELAFFPESDFDVRRFKRDLPDAFIKDEFSAYQERFRGLMGIDNERALRLLHKTQSAKNLGDLNEFLRDFMLDEPGTFEVATRLVDEFGELNAAHQAVVQARKQIDMLIPARKEYARYHLARDKSLELEEIRLGVEQYREQRRKALLEARIRELSVMHEGLSQEAQRLGALAGQEFDKLRDLQDRRRNEGGGLLEQLAADIAAAEIERDTCFGKRSTVEGACSALGKALPVGALAFAQLSEEARQRLDGQDVEMGAAERRRDALKEEERTLTVKFSGMRREIEAMERQSSNIPSHMLDIRAAMAEALGVDEERLPFAGELIEVRDETKAWQGAIERVLHGFATSLLVDERYYAAVSGYLNDRNIGGRLVYLRMLAHPASNRTLSNDSLVRKLKIAEVAQSTWVREELAANFNYECTETVSAFRNAPRAVTLQGQIKHGPVRHEKNDRFRIDDRSQWVTGFDNANKLALYRTVAANVGEKLEAALARIRETTTDNTKRQTQLLACNTLINYSWSEIDIASALNKVHALTARRVAEKAKRPDLAKLDADIEKQEGSHKSAVARAQAEQSRLQRAKDDLKATVERHQSLPPELVDVALTPLQQTGLATRFEALVKPVTLESLSDLTTRVVSGISDEDRIIREEINGLKSSIEQRFADFRRTWPAEAGGLDPKLASADDFLAKLARLESDGLPRYEARFFELLRDQSDQNLTLLSSQLSHERKAILDRLELVNESLLTAEFNEGTHLVIETSDKSIEDVRAFKQTLHNALSRSFSDDVAVIEERFDALSRLVQRLSSTETVDRHWRALVLDVRLHVEFKARERDGNDVEVEVYRSGEGKSGGQRQKLSATCLAAALRYQLSGQDRALPSFSTVVLDEAFDKADAEFTTMTMNIFKTFGFQMVVATPVKSVMTLEPFIGGACYVHIRDRKTSSVLMIEYEGDTQRLKLTEEMRDESVIA